MKKTDWYPVDVAPVREGVYELLNVSTNRVFFSRWIIKEMFGRFGSICLGGWGRGESTIEEATKCKEFGLVQNRWPWRGLQGDAHSLKIGASMFLVNFSEGPDRPYAED